MEGGVHTTIRESSFYTKCEDIFGNPPTFTCGLVYHTFKFAKPQADFVKFPYPGNVLLCFLLVP